jgi:nicotinamide-nucleotide adenylyltransferase
MAVNFTPQTIEQFRIINTLLEVLDPQGPPQALVLPPAREPAGHIIVLSAAFNPPTQAHLALLRQAQAFARQAGDSDDPGRAQPSLYAAVSKHIVDKEYIERPLLLDRLVLLQEVLQSHLASVGILLFNRGLYVEQATAIRRCFPAVTRLTFLVGFDKVVQIFDPRYYSDRESALRALFSLADLLVAPRGAAGESSLRELLERTENRPYASFIQILPFDPAYRAISSTRVRQDPQAHARDVPPEVLRFINETHAYDPPAAEGGAPDPYSERVQAISALLRTRTPDET